MVLQTFFNVLKYTNFQDIISTFPKSLKRVQAKQCSPPKIGFRKKKSTILPTKYGAFLVENSGIEPLTSCMPCKRSPS